MAIYTECVENLKSDFLFMKICHLERFEKHPTCPTCSLLLKQLFTWHNFWFDKFRFMRKTESSAVDSGIKKFKKLIEIEIEDIN